MKKATIIGGGFTGFVWAYLLSKRDYQVTILEKSDVVGGGIRTLYYNGHPYTHGPRLFMTKKQEAFDFVNSICPQRVFKHYLKSYVAEDDAFYSYPPHADDVANMPDSENVLRELEECRNAKHDNPPANFEENSIRSLGPTIYRKIIKNYTSKAWGIPSNTLIDAFNYDDKGITLCTGGREVLPECIYSYPIHIDGWDDFFRNIEKEENIVVHKNVNITEYDLKNKRIVSSSGTFIADFIVSTISPDELFDYKYGKLPYMGRKMSHIMMPFKNLFPEDLNFIHYTGDEPYTRITDYDKITGYQSENTLLGIEYPCVGPKDYPYPFKTEIERAQKYIRELPEGVISEGRLGKYKYLALTNSIEDALNYMESNFK